jgi:hypothetical protein
MTVVRTPSMSFTGACLLLGTSTSAGRVMPTARAASPVHRRTQLCCSHTWTREGQGCMCATALGCLMRASVQRYSYREGKRSTEGREVAATHNIWPSYHSTIICLRMEPTWLFTIRKVPSPKDPLGFHIFPGLVISIRSLLLLHVLMVLLQRTRCGSVHCGCHRLRCR